MKCINQGTGNEPIILTFLQSNSTHDNFKIFTTMTMYLMNVPANQQEHAI